MTGEYENVFDTLICSVCKAATTYLLCGRRTVKWAETLQKV